MPASGGKFLHTGAQDALQLRVRQSRQGAEIRLLGHDRGDQPGLGFLRKGAPAGEHLIKDQPEGEDVGPAVALAAFQLFGGHVRQSAHDGSLGGERLATGGGGSGRRGGQPEVQHLDASRRQHDVFGLEVAVDDALGMRGFQGVGHGQRPPAQARAEGFALHVLHHQETGIALIADIVERADVRMIERGDGPRLALEALPHGRREGRAGT